MEKLRKRVEVVVQALKGAGAIVESRGVDAQGHSTLKVDCRDGQGKAVPLSDPGIKQCNVSGYAGARMAYTYDRRPGLKGFRASVWVPEQDADKNRTQREKNVIEWASKDPQQWEYFKLRPSIWGGTQKSYKTTYQHGGIPLGEVGGEVWLCDINASIWGEVLGKEVLLDAEGRYDKKRNEEEGKKLRDQIQQEVKAKLLSFAQAAAPAAECTKTEEVEIPELPLVIPAAALEGTLKDVLLAKKSEVLQLLAAAKQIRERRTAAGKDSEKLDTFRYLLNWHTENRGLLDVEVRARAAAEEFFWKLGSAYDRMSDAERTKVETGLLDRALALRRYRTVQRGAMKAKAGQGIAAYADLDAYYTALSRANWAGLELLALVRMAEPINGARLGLYGNYDVYELSDPRPDPQRVAAIEMARRRHFETLCDLAIMAVLGGEVQFDVVIEARKDRLFGLKEIWGGDKPNPGSAQAQKEILGFWTKLGQGTGQLFNSGFGLFDVAAGAGADAFRSGLYYLPWVGGQFKTRAEKLEQQATENWEKIQQKILLLRLLKGRNLNDVRQLAEYAVARGIHQTPIAATLSRSLDPTIARALVEDRAFVVATDGGLHRLLGAALVDLRQRGRMELRIATEKTRLAQRDMEAALRVEQGQDPDTGDLTWGTILSPTGWMDVASKGKGFLWRQESDDFRQRGAQINLKSQQMLDMFKLDGPLLRVEYDFEALAPDDMDRHAKLWERSAPYIAFVQRMREERRAGYLHGWRRATDFTRPAAGGGPMSATVLHALAKDPEVGALKKFHEELIQSVTLAERKAEMRRALDLTYEDHVFAWDLSGALSLAAKLRNDSEDPALAKLYDARYRLLLAAVAWDRVKEQNISWLRNVGDAGFTTALFGAAGLTGGPAPASFGRFFWETINPFAAAKTLGGPTPGLAATAQHSARAVLTQTVTEILVGDIGVPGTGQKYEALLNQTLSTLVAGSAKLFEKVGTLNLRKRLADAVAGEQKRNPELDGSRYLADLLNRSVVEIADRIAAHGQRYVRAAAAAVRQSVERQARGDARLMAAWTKAQKLAAQARALRETLAKARADKKTFQEKMIETFRPLEDALLPPTREYYEWLFQTRVADFFDAAKGRDIEKLRHDFRVMRKLTRPEDRPALDALEARIDQERTNRFTRAIVEFLAGARVEGVILNGTRKGNPEYKGIFSDLDFTIVTKPGVDPADVKAKVDAAFKKHGIELNGEGRRPSADMEAMVQPFLPGELRPIKTWEDFEQWALTMIRDPHRYLSAGGAVWVGFYNYLNGDTVSPRGGVDGAPNPKLLPQPDLHPMHAFGLVLDNARFDLSLRLGDIPDAKTLGDLIGARAKYVMRAVDALIWALHPNLLKARTPEEAKKKGYHTLLVEDAKRLADERLLTPREYQVIQLLEKVKSGRSIFQAGNIDAGAAEAHRALLDETWKTMDGLMRRAAKETREVYLDWLDRLARDVADDPQRRQLLFTLAFLNWNTARFIGDAATPQKLADLMADTETPRRLAEFMPNPPGDPLQRMKLEEQLTIGLGTLDQLPAEPHGGLAIWDPHPLRARSTERPAEGAEPVVTAVGLKPGGGPRAPPRAVPLAELFVPTDVRAYVLKGDGYVYVDGEKVGVVKPARGQDRFELVHDVVAFRLGRLLDVNVPHAERVRLADGETVLVTRKVPGHEPGRDSLRNAMFGRD
ncbi:MAG: hypothetical protein HY725_17790, partial [Candidatus Rokubacteria bacterium]|nr:hypothetical protein [Candidatus Rokubacteria bacterium]